MGMEQWNQAMQVMAGQELQMPPGLVVEDLEGLHGLPCIEEGGSLYQGHWAAWGKSS